MSAVRTMFVEIAVAVALVTGCGAMFGVRPDDQIAPMHPGAPVIASVDRSLVDSVCAAYADLRDDTDVAMALAGSTRASDLRIARTVRDDIVDAVALSPHDRVHVVASHGVITLRGRAAADERSRIVRLAREASGVVHVRDEIEVAPPRDRNGGEEP